MNEFDNEKIKAAIDLTAKLTVEVLAKDLKQPVEKILISFLESNTGRMLYDDKTKLWWDGPAAIVEQYKAEISESDNNLDKITL